MMPKTVIPWVALGLAALAGGCAVQSTVTPYESMPEIDRARAAADLVVQGLIAGTEAGPRYAVPDRPAYPHFFGKVFTRQAVKTRVTMNVEEVLKGPADLGPSVSFWMVSPCDPLDPNVLLGHSLPPALEGSRLRVFLEKQADEWWIIAHEPWYRKVEFDPEAARVRIKTPSAKFLMVPGPVLGEAPADAGAAAASGPGQANTAGPAAPAPAATAAPAPPRPTSRLQKRPAPNRSWPPPRQPAQ